MAQGRPVDRARLLKKLPNLRQVARSFGLEPLREFDASLFPDEVLPAIPYAELFAGEWDKDDVRKRLDAAAPDLKEQLGSLREEYRDQIARWLDANIRFPGRAWEQLGTLERQRIWEQHPEWKGYAAHWGEQQSEEYHAMRRLTQAWDIAYFELNPPPWTRR